MRYYISDLHFFHESLNTQMDCRGFKDAAQMNAYMIKQWNSRVRPKDEVVILGDFSVGKAKETNEVLSQLNGTLYMIKGNHDRWSKDSVCKGYFQGIYDYKMISDNGREVVLSHYPILFYQNQHKGAIHLYGHVHNTKEEELFQTAITNVSSDINIPMNSYNVGCMIKYMDYTPRTLDQIMTGEAK